jgi:hypothetical protein
MLSCASGCGCGKPYDELIPWSGQRPDAAAAEEFGFYCYWDKDGAGQPEENYGWVPVNKFDARATPDLNRVYSDCTWNAVQKKWVKKDIDS